MLLHMPLPTIAALYVFTAFPTPVVVVKILSFRGGFGEVG